MKCYKELSALKTPYPFTLESFNLTVMNRGLTGAWVNKRQQTVTLFAIAYTIPELEIPLAIFLSLPNWKSIMEQTWGKTTLLKVNIRLTHITGKAVKHDLMITVQQTQYFSILMGLKTQGLMPMK